MKRFAVLFVALGIAAPCLAEPLRIATVPGLAELARGLAESASLEVTVKTFPRAHDAIYQVAGDRFELALLSDPPDPGQQRTLSIKRGRVPQTTAVGWQAVKFIVHPDNPVDAIAESHARQLLAPDNCFPATPSVRIWEELGGEGLKVETFVPFADNPLAALIERTVFPTECGWREDCVRVSSEAAILRKVVAIPEALGVVSQLRYAGAAKVLSVTSEGGVAAPNPKNFQSGAYPFCKKLWLVSSKRFFHPAPASLFRSHLLSPEGRAEFKRLGFYPLR